MFLNSLRGRLVLLVTLTVLPVILVLLQALRTERALLRSAAAEAVLVAARQAAEDHALALSAASESLHALAGDRAVLSQDPAACFAAATRLKESHPGYANVGAVLPTGEVFCSAVRLKQSLNLTDRGYVHDALRTGTLAVGDYQVGRITGKPGVNMGYPAVDDAGETRAVVFLALDLDALAHTLSLAALPEGATVRTLDRNGVILAQYPTDPGAGLSHGRADLARAHADGAHVEPIGGDLVAVAPLGATGGAWVEVEVPQASYFATSEATWRAGVALALALAGGTILGAWWVGERLIVGRVEALSAFAGRVASGDLSARSSLRHDPDAIGQLAGALDAMAEALDADRARRVQLEDQLRQAQKMEVVGRLAGGVAHDFNNLLTSILGYGELLRDRMGPENAARELDEMIKSGHRAAALTRQLLAFSRQESFTPRVLDPNALVRGTERLLRRVLGEEVALVVELDPSVRNVRADAGQLEQVLLNLAVNARDAMGRRGKLRLSTRAVGRDVEIAVQDDGSGMTEEVKRRIFEPFFTTKATGTGLGLAIVREVVDRVGGSIFVETLVGRGTTFRVRIPGTSEAVEPAWELDGGPGSGTETVLLVDDDSSVRALVRRALETAGYLVIEAVDGEDAEACADAWIGPIHLLLTDIALPGLDGVALAARLRDARPEVRCLYMTGYAAPEGTNPRMLLQKPFGVHLLARRVRSAIDGTLEQASGDLSRPEGLPPAV